MEVHSSQRRAVLAKKLWNMLRVTLAIMRKGMIPKRKLMNDIHLMMKKGKLLRKSLLNSMAHNHPRRARGGFGPFGIKEYEFSCSNSPTPAFLHIRKRRKANFFPCIKPAEALVDDDFVRQEQQSIVLLPKTPEVEYLSTFQFDNVSDYSNGENPIASAMQSPLSIRVSNYSSDNDDENCEEGNREVDDQAEEFIRRFYDQLRVQSCGLLLQYQEMQYQEMLARGT